MIFALFSIFSNASLCLCIPATPISGNVNAFMPKYFKQNIISSTTYWSDVPPDNMATFATLETSILSFLIIAVLP